MNKQTISAPSAASLNFLEYQRILVQAHLAVARGDEAEADRLRDRSDEIAEDLTWEETRWLHGLSGDLFMLTGEEIPERSDLPTSNLLLTLRDATFRMDGNTMLRLLRQGPNLPPKHIAYLRSNAYDHLGFTETSLAFMRHAVKLAPEDDQYVCLILERLNRLGRLDEAREMALASLDRSVISDDLVIFAAGTLLSSARGLDEAAAHPLCERAVKVLDPLLSSPERVTELGLQEHFYALITLGCCSKLMGDMVKARDAFSALLAVEPTNPDFLVLRGEASLEEDRAQALSDFTLAVSHNARQSTPYFILAHEELMEGRYSRCQQLCQSLIALPGVSPAVLSMALEFQAVCYFYTDQPAALVRETFLNAIEINPDSERLRQLAQAFFADLDAGQPRNNDLSLPDLVHSEHQESEFVVAMQRSARADAYETSARFMPGSQRETVGAV